MKARVKARSSSELPVKNEITISNYTGPRLNIKTMFRNATGLGIHKEQATHLL